MALQEDEVLAKPAVKLRVDMFCLAWCFNSLRIGRGTLPIGAPEGLGVTQILEQEESARERALCQLTECF